MVATAKKSDGDLPANVSVDEFLVWVADKPGRFELHDGTIVSMAPERVGHASVKGKVFRALGDAIERAKLTCSALPDGVGVKVSERKWYQPDALVYCGPPAPPDDIFVPAPVIVVEVGSPSTAHIDELDKLIGYFSIPSVQHYLLFNPHGPPLVHHQRQNDGSILTRIVSSGPIHLDPPGLELDVERCFA